ncbi:hypothetical protein C8F01DRAFT_222084 [Mycena amicta]|nr:hypothetical protein C8F01DRAFT_222084 [Mycena amicta]
MRTSKKSPVYFERGALPNLAVIALPRPKTEQKDGENQTGTSSAALPHVTVTVHPSSFMISEPGLASVLGSPFDALSSSSSQAPASESAASESKQSTPASDESLDDGVELLIETQRSAKLPKDNGLFLDATNSAFVDKTSFFRSLPDRFEYFLLRPPRFGKTAFISTLQAFYDINGATQFSDRFGSLAVGHKTPSTLQHSHHLCMTFPFDILGSHLSFKLVPTCSLLSFLQDA